MAYQPVLDLRSGRTVGHEALARGTGGETPDKLFEKLGVKERRQLELEALRRAVLEAPEGLLFVNLSPAVFSYKLGNPARSALRRTPPERVVVEITEHMPVPENFNLAVMLWKEAGYRLAVDDVGGAAISLALVFMVRPQYVKLDRRVVTGLSQGDRARSVLRFARGMKAKVIAEGIETEEQLQAVKELNIAWGQGYLLGRPAFADALAQEAEGS